MRHSYAGLAVPDFPTMGGSFIPGLGNQFLAEVNRLRAELKLPAVDIVQVYLHLLHRLFAVFVVLSFIPLFFFVRRRIAPGILWLQRARSLTIFSAILLFVQFCLGIFTLLTLRNPWVASLHVMLGALLLAFAVLIAIRFYYYVT